MEFIFNNSIIFRLTSDTLEITPSSNLSYLNITINNKNEQTDSLILSKQDINNIFLSNSNNEFYNLMFYEDATSIFFNIRLFRYKVFLEDCFIYLNNNKYKEYIPQLKQLFRSFGYNSSIMIIDMDIANIIYNIDSIDTHSSLRQRQIICQKYGLCEECFKHK